MYWNKNNKLSLDVFLPLEFLFVIIINLFQGCLYTSTLLLYHYGVLSLWSAVRNPPRWKGVTAKIDTWLVKTDCKWDELPSQSQNYSSGSEISKVSLAAICFELLTHFRLNRLPPTLCIGTVKFQIRYVRLCDLDISKQKWLNYLQTRDPVQIPVDLDLVNTVISEWIFLPDIIIILYTKILNKWCMQTV